jgi:hypothetical protein
MAFGYVSVHQKARVPFCFEGTKVDVDIGRCGETSRIR